MIDMPRGSADAAKDRAITLFRAGDYAGAAAALTELITIGPATHALFFQRGAAYYNSNNDVVADADFTEALLRNNKPANYHLFRARTRLRLGRLDDAVADFAAALDRDPTCAEAAWGRGRIHSSRGQWSLAARDFGRVIAMTPNDALALSARGEMFHRLNDWPRCLADYRRAAELTPTDPKTLNRLAWVLATCPVDQMRDGATAMRLAEQANQLAASTDPLILDTLAVAHAECGDFEQALAVIQRARNIEPGNDEVARHAAAFATRQPWRDTIS
jgi:tetratricopeptide (TPR) repeat protein